MKSTKPSNGIRYIWVDPANGWRYGFPKIVAAHLYSEKWLIKNGYPREEITALGDRFYARVWTATENDVNGGVPTSPRALSKPVVGFPEAGVVDRTRQTASPAVATPESKPRAKSKAKAKSKSKSRAKSKSVTKVAKSKSKAKSKSVAKAKAKAKSKTKSSNRNK